MFYNNTCIDIFQKLNDKARILKAEQPDFFEVQSFEKGWLETSTPGSKEHMLCNILTGKQKGCLKNTIGHNDRGGWIISIQTNIWTF